MRSFGEADPGVPLNAIQILDCFENFLTSSVDGFIGCIYTELDTSVNKMQCLPTGDSGTHRKCGQIWWRTLQGLLQGEYGCRLGNEG